MPLGQLTKELVHPRPVAETLAEFKHVLAGIGTIIRTEDDRGVVVGRVKQGLQTVTIWGAIDAHESGSRITVTAQRSSFLPPGSTAKVIGRLATALGQPHERPHQPLWLSGLQIMGVLLLIAVLIAQPFTVLIPVGLLMVAANLYTVRAARKLSATGPSAAANAATGKGRIVGTLGLIALSIALLVHTRPFLFLDDLLGHPVPESVVNEGIDLSCNQYDGEYCKLWDLGHYEVSDFYRTTEDGRRAWVLTFIADATPAENPFFVRRSMDSVILTGKFMATKKGKHWYLQAKAAHEL